MRRPRVVLAPAEEEEDSAAGEEAGDGLSVAGAACSCLSATELLLPPFAGAARRDVSWPRRAGFRAIQEGLACAAGKGGERPASIGGHGGKQRRV